MIAAGILVGAAALAPAQRGGFGYGRGWGRGYGGPRHYSSFGLGFGGYAPARVEYHNPFTGDVEYAERTSNEFRHDYERRKGDPLRIKDEVQRLDKTLEKLRGEAIDYGSVTDRGRDLMRDVLEAEDRIDRRFRGSDDPMRGQWTDLRREIDRLANAYHLD